MTRLSQDTNVLQASRNVARATARIAQAGLDGEPHWKVAALAARLVRAEERREKAILAVLARQDAERPAFQRQDRERRGCIRLVADVLAAE